MNAELSLNVSSLKFLSLLKSKDLNAIEYLVRSYTGDLFKAALGLGFDSSNAEELVQSVWASFFESVSNFQGKSHIRTFIFGILYNKASEARRHQARFEPDPIEEIVDSRFSTTGNWIKPPISPEQFMLAVESFELINKCIDGLPLNQRMAFCLKEIDEHGSTDICNILNVSVTNLGVLLYRAKNRLRECIENKAGATAKKV